MSSGAVLQTLLRQSDIDQYALTDPVNKFRVTTPENLIDTDFEYSLQSHKWETLELVNNIPTFFYRDNDDKIDILNVSSIKDSNIVHVTTQSHHNFIIGTPFYIVGLKSKNAEGLFYVLSVIDETTFCYEAKSTFEDAIYLNNINITVLYLARIYQGARYNHDDIEYIKTNEDGKLIVKTKDPHGFIEGTKFSLTRSIGNKTLYFNGSDITINTNNITSITVSTISNNIGGNGFTLKKVNPYDWKARKTLYFTSYNVNTAASCINIYNHGFNEGDIVMYVPPIGDSPLNGLIPYQAYSVYPVTPHDICFKSFVPNIINGFYTCIYKNGYFAENINLRKQYYPTSSHYLDTLSFSSMGNAIGDDIATVEITGYFKAATTGDWTFYMRSSGIAYMWFGDDSISGYTISNYNIKSVGIIENSYTISLIKDSIYPIRIIYGKDTSLSQFELSFEGPERAKNNNGTGYFYFISSDYTLSNTVNIINTGTCNYGMHALLKAYAVSNISRDNNKLTVNGIQDIKDTNQPLAIFSGCTMTKTFGVYNIVNSSNNISTNNYTKYYIKGTPKDEGIQICTSPNSSFVNITDTTMSGLSWVIPISTILEYDCIFHELHEFNNDDPVLYEIESGNGPLGLINGNTYYVEKVNDMAFRLKPQPGEISSTIDIQSISDSVIKFTRTTLNTHKNKIYIKSHSLINGTKVIYDSNGYNAIGDLINQECYYTINVSNDYFALTTIKGNTNTIVALDDVNDGTRHIIKTVDSKCDGKYKIGNIENSNIFSLDTGFIVSKREFVIDMRKNVIIHLNMIYYHDHSLYTGCSIHIDDNIYYVIRIDSSHFKIASTYTNAMNGISTLLTNLLNTNIIYTYDIGGDLYINNAIDLVNGSNEINSVCDCVYFKTYFKVGDTLRVEVKPSIINYIISEINGYNIIFNSNHGLSDGDYIYYVSETSVDNGNIYYVRVTGLSANTINIYESYNDAIDDVDRVIISLNGNFIKRMSGNVYNFPITLVISNSKLISSVNSTITSKANLIIGTGLYPVTDGYVSHRPYDGGVELVPSTNPDTQIIRQTRKYIKYQSGKGIQVSKSVNFNMPVEIQSLTRVGYIASVKTRIQHRISVGSVINIIDAGDWNGSYQVIKVEDDMTFKFMLEIIPSDSIASGFPKFIPESWVNSKLRIGIFDDQNGLFFEYDGNNLYAVRRSSTQQLQGSCDVEFGKSLIKGKNTCFKSTLAEGNMIVIKGQSYKVVNIVNDTSLYVQPTYRGCTNISSIITKTEDTKIPQKYWSIDPCDGTGETFYNLDVKKIQMLYIDYSWYGAGKVRFGIKDGHGNVRYVHEFVHNNIMSEAYMRSGNIPARYEISVSGIPSYVPSLMHWGTSIIMDGGYNNDKSYLITASGHQIIYACNDILTTFVSIKSQDLLNTYQIYDPTYGKQITAYRINANVYSMIQNIKSGTPISGNGIDANTYTIGTPIKGINAGGYIYINKCPLNNIDNTEITLGWINNVIDFIPEYTPLISIRLSPSVDNGLSGSLGYKEIINRMQVFLKSLDILTTHDCEVSVLLNTTPSCDYQWEKPKVNSLCQVLYHKKGDTVNGGITIYNFRVSGGVPDNNMKRVSVNTNMILEDLPPIGNSILGGDDIYPNGPDMITIVATLLDSSGISITTPFSITGRLTWIEGQS